MYEFISNVLGTDDKNCKIKFQTLEFDTTNGSTVYNSLTRARSTLENNTVAVAIGSQIDVFTSIDYVITQQVHLVTSSEQGMESAERVIPIMPDPESLSMAVGKTIKALDWKKVAFLAQDDFSPVHELGKEDIFVWPIMLPDRIASSDDLELQHTLINLREAQMEKFILHSMNKSVVKTVIQADFREIVDGLNEMATLYGFQLLNPSKIPKKAMESFNGTMSRLDIGIMVDVVGILRHYLNKFVQNCSKEVTEDRFISASDFKKQLTLEKLTYNGALGDYVWVQYNENNGGNVRNRYQIPIYRYVDTLDNIGESIFSRDGINTRTFATSGKKLDVEVFKGKNFSVLAKQDEPFVMYRDGKYVGFCVDVLKELSKELNFNFFITELPKEIVLENRDKSEWDLIINELKQGNASIAIGAMAVKADREEQISFSYTIISSSVSMLQKRTPDTRHYFQFLWPFSTWLWLTIVAFFALVGLSLFFMSKYDKTQQESDQRFDLKESMWYSLSVLLQGSTEYSPQTTSMRTIVAFFWFCTLVINAAYTANLAAFLTLQQIDNRITTVDALARQTSFKYGIINNTDLMDFFAKSRDEPYERMWVFMKLQELESLLPNRTVALQQVASGQFALLDDGVINDYLAQWNCETESIEQNFGYKHFSMGFPKGAPYRDDINRALLALKEKGKLDDLRAKWWSSSENCTADDRSNTKVKSSSELDLTNMLGVFIILIASAILSIAWEAGEVIFKFYENTKKDKHQEKVNENSTDVDKGTFIRREIYEADLGIA
ncbi:hypothetical protein CHS0354_040810 [Potamilus streckersoni]|uniref:Glutamate receptor n=1 Tax=Potamilus streckersoni TaxID=2493646 RepID=A0AAE0SLR9_9BIVA|nr:hypothetical protein CHS0354_040810 [Potamilus streckersoni]